MPRVGYNPANVTIKTDAGTTTDKAHLAHYQVAAADAVAADADGVLDDTNLGAAAQVITAGITDPAVPRGLTVTGNVSGITGNVVITGTDAAGAALTETIALNGTGTIAGAKAFRSVVSVALPVQVHTPAAQTETIEVTHGVNSEADGNITVTITSTALGEDSPFDVVVAVTDDMDTVTEVAAAIVEALNEDETVAAHFIASNDAGVITLTALTPLANDATLAIAVVDTDTTGVTVGSSTNGTAGVPYDIVTVGWSDILGLPYKLAHNTVLATYVNNAIETTAPTVTTSATVLASNTLDPNSALAGTAVDIYLIV